MVEAQEITSQIQFDPDYRGLHATYSPSLGYAYTDALHNSEASMMRIIGFTGKRQQPRLLDEATEDIASVTEYSELQADERTINMQGRGVGTRMYNTPQALLGTGEGDVIQAYMFKVDPNKIVDRRRYSDGTMRGRVSQAARQAGRIIRTKAQGLDVVVDSIHDSFGDPDDVDGVLYSQSLRMEVQQTARGVEDHTGIPPAFMVIRNPHIIMRKIGEYQSQ